MLDAKSYRLLTINSIRAHIENHILSGIDSRKFMAIVDNFSYDDDIKDIIIKELEDKGLKVSTVNEKLFISWK